MGPRGDSIKDGRHLATAEHHQPKTRWRTLKNSCTHQPNKGLPSIEKIIKLKKRWLSYFTKTDYHIIPKKDGRHSTA